MIREIPIAVTEFTRMQEWKILRCSLPSQDKLNIMCDGLSFIFFYFLIVTFELGDLDRTVVSLDN
jgi:hypothetical protein